MKLVEKGNVQLSVSEEEVEKYLANGYVLYEKPAKKAEHKKEELEKPKNK